jgi:imidazole glycerol phosphate synthase glutamine amidotransferase subunit
MQLLYDGSEEAPGVGGLGLLPGTVRRIRTELPLPHVGWNAVEFIRGAETDLLLAGVAGPEPRWFYHVHSYAVLESDTDAVLGRCTYDDAFASISGRDHVWGIQFHPEKSQEDGLRILRNFAAL